MPIRTSTASFHSIVCESSPENDEIGKVAPRLWSGFMGRIYNRSKILEESGPAFAEALLADNVDILLAAPS